MKILRHLISILLIVLISTRFAIGEDIDLSKPENKKLENKKEDNVVTDYQIICKPFVIDKNRYLAIRSFYLNGKRKVLAVNVDTLETNIFDWNVTNTEGFNIADSRYFKLLNNSVSIELHNGGLKNGNTDFVYLTVDLCPSSKKEPFELNAIQEFIKKGHKNIAFAVSGRWFIKNKKYIDWIKENINKGILNVVWINHTYNHFYDKKLPLEKNFLLKEGTDIFFEITEVEKLLIKNNIIPSIFIRFPGLVADYNLRKKVAFDFFLIAVGSDAWLANNPNVSSGSIILIHGNKNEPRGIKIFKKLLEEKQLNFGSLLDIQP